MLFTEPAALFVFLPIVMAVTRFLPRAACNYALLLLSLLFYAIGEPRHVALLVICCVMNYAFGILLENRVPDQRRGLLAIGVGINLAMLLFYKYLLFLVSNLNAVLGFVSTVQLAEPNVQLPLGISFFTFQAISYLMDVASGRVRAERNPAYLALYVSLFPQLVAGPIVRFSHVAEDLRERDATLTDWSEGLRLFVLGLGRKMLIANSLAVTADALFRLPSEQLNAPLAWMGVLCYALQIFFDFSGYSAMAIGIGRVLGFRFAKNFNYPYCATSIQDFWRRWHMSLSTWFRDYLYIPLGGSRLGSRRTAANLCVVFLLCGLWHGASWNFVIWGALHGLFLAVERCRWMRFITGTPVLNRVYTLVVVLIGWVFFRCETVAESTTWLRTMFLGGQGSLDLALFAGPVTWLALIFGVAWSTPLFPYLSQRTIRDAADKPRRNTAHDAVALCSLMVIAVLSISQSASNTFNPFIYFRF